jgi:hypothetical protein
MRVPATKRSQAALQLSGSELHEHIIVPIPTSARVTRSKREQVWRTYSSTKSTCMADSESTTPGADRYVASPFINANMRAREVRLFYKLDAERESLVWVAMRRAPSRRYRKTPRV